MLFFSSLGYSIDEKKVKGGEACLWSEYFDNENLIQTTWLVSARAPHTHARTTHARTHTARTHARTHTHTHPHARTHT